MRIRKLPFGDKNLIGARVIRIRKEQDIKQKELLAQLQLHGVEMNGSSLSKLEGQTRTVTDKELVALSDIFKVPVTKLLGSPRQV